jgi:hypothetical protein
MQQALAEPPSCSVQHALRDLELCPGPSGTYPGAPIITCGRPTNAIGRFIGNVAIHEECRENPVYNFLFV